MLGGNRVGDVVLALDGWRYGSMVVLQTRLSIGNSCVRIEEVLRHTNHSPHGSPLGCVVVERDDVIVRGGMRAVIEYCSAVDAWSHEGRASCHLVYRPCCSDCSCRDWCRFSSAVYPAVGSGAI